MTFRIKRGRGFVNEGETYTAQIVAKKLNGYKVINPSGNIVFLDFDSIDIIDISDAEKNTPLEW